MAENISVIVPAFNAGKYLLRCIESIEKQNYPSFDIIIVNDGSTDNTQDIIDELLVRYDNVRSANTGNKDIVFTRNMGLSMVKGEYFTFVDADDVVKPDLLSTLMNTMNETGADVVGCSFCRWSTDEEWQQELLKDRSADTAVAKQLKVKTYTPKEYLNEEVFKGNSRCWSKLYKRSIVGDLQFDERAVVGEDLLFLVRLLHRISTIAEIDYEGYGYYHNASGAMLRPFKPRYMHQISCWELAREEASIIDSSTYSLSTRNLLMGIVLTAGKLAELDKENKKLYREYIDICHEKIVAEMKDKSGYKLLPTGYRIKASLFKNTPKLFLWAYGFHKYWAK